MRKFVGAIIIAAMVVGAGWNFNQSKKEVSMSNLVLANVEALANGESTGPGNYHIDEDITQHSRDGVIYKESKVIDCTEGGSSACSPGKYYRYKNDGGSWDNWTPA